MWAISGRGFRRIVPRSSVPCNFRQVRRRAFNMAVLREMGGRTVATGKGGKSGTPARVLRQAIHRAGAHARLPSAYQGMFPDSIEFAHAVAPGLKGHATHSERDL